MAGFGRPQWELFGAGNLESAAPTAVSGPDTTEEDKGNSYSIQLRILRRGDKGIRVERLQQLLSARGYWRGGRTYNGKETADGDFGAATEVAVKDVQLAAKLKQDGIVGPDTMTVLLTT